MFRKRGRKTKAELALERLQQPMLKTDDSDEMRYVTGVSRTGRVRKKSCKLMGYESGPDDADKPVRKKDLSLSPYSSSSRSSTGQQTCDSDFLKHLESRLDMDGVESDPLQSDESLVEEDPGDYSFYPNKNFASTPKKLGSFDQSLMSFKKKNLNHKQNSKRHKMKRFSAYLLWAKLKHQESLRTNPNMDYSQLSSALSSKWATVPLPEKYAWKCTAKSYSPADLVSADAIYTKFLQCLPKNYNLQVKYPAAMDTSVPSSSRSTCSNSNFEQRYREDVRVAKRTVAYQQQLLNDSRRSCHQAMLQDGAARRLEEQTLARQKAKILQDSMTEDPPILSKCKPTVTASHLKLLGDSLNIIGERLNEHEGQIMVSGSPSVLYDSLLCAVGPLMYSTQIISGLEHNDTRNNLMRVMDNIAYIMPGL